MRATSSAGSDRFQKESDDLLHAILPDEIAARLKSDRAMFVCESRGVVPVKGKGDMETYLLVSRR